MSKPTYKRVRVVCGNGPGEAKAAYIATITSPRMFCPACEMSYPAAGNHLHSVTPVRKGDS